jgi:hypothetical protein
MLTVFFADFCVFVQTKYYEFMLQNKFGAALSTKDMSDHGALD